MAFRYEVVNLELIDSLKELLKKPTNELTDDEVKQVHLILGAIRISLDYGAKIKAMKGGGE